MMYVGPDGWVYHRNSTGHAVRVEERTEEILFHSLGFAYSPGRAKALASGLAILNTLLDDPQGVDVEWKGGDPYTKYGAITLNLDSAQRVLRERFGLNVILDQDQGPGIHSLKGRIC